MISILVNGQNQSLIAPISLEELLRNLNLRGNAIAVAINEEIVPRSEFSRKMLKHQDRIEVVRPIGGG